MKPFRRPGLHPSFGCVAITVRGRRCGHPHYTAVPVTFEWDPTKGIGIGGPHATFCRMHAYNHCLERHERVEVVGGWLGYAWNDKAKVWTVLTTVYETKDGLDPSAHWWELRYPTRSGVHDSVTYDMAVARRDAARLESRMQACAEYMPNGPAAQALLAAMRRGDAE